MILLSEIFEQLYYGELAQTVIGNNGALGIKTAQYPRMIAHINLGVQALYERFALWEKEFTLQQYEGITNYNIDYDFAQTNTESTEIYKYIMDSAASPFNASQFLKVQSVWSEAGEEYVLNPISLEDELDSQLIAYTPAQEILQLPYPVSTAAVFVIYLSAPNNIPLTTTTLTTKINLPRVLLVPLLSFIAERYFTNMTAEQKESIVYPKKYEIACQQVDTSGLVNHNETYAANRFRRGGWQ